MTTNTWNGAAGDYLDPAQWTPGDVPLYGADTVATVGAGTAILSDAEPDGITLTLGVAQSGTAGASPTLVLSNGALGPDMTLDAIGQATLGVDGYDTAYGQINVSPPGNAGFQGRATLTISIGAGSQLNQEGTIAVVSPQTVGSTGATLFLAGSGTLNNDGEIYVGPGSTAQFGLSAQSPYSVTGSGTVTVDHATANLFGAASTQTVDLLGGTLNTNLSLAATIKDWNDDGRLMFNASVFVDSVQFNQTSDAGGDLQLFNGTRQVGDLNLLGTYATSDFVVAQSRSGIALSVSGHAPPPPA